MKGRLLLNVVIGEGTTVLKLLAGEDQTLLVGRNTLLVLNLGFDVVDGVGRLDLKGDGLARKGLNEAINIVSVSSSIHRRCSWQNGLRGLTSALEKAKC